MCRCNCRYVLGVHQESSHSLDVYNMCWRTAGAERMGHKSLSSSSKLQVSTQAGVRGGRCGVTQLGSSLEVGSEPGAGISLFYFSGRMLCESRLWSVIHCTAPPWPGAGLKFILQLITRVHSAPAETECTVCRIETFISTESSVLTATSALAAAR